MKYEDAKVHICNLSSPKAVLSCREHRERGNLEFLTTEISLVHMMLNIEGID